LAFEEVTYEDNEDEYIILDIKYLDPSDRKRDQIRNYERWLMQYDTDIGLVDYGFGEQAMESLQNGDDTVDPDGYMDTVFAVHYGNVKDRTDIKWVKDDDGNKLFFTCDKSRSATRMVETFRDQQWVIPRATTNSSGVQLRNSEDDGVKLVNQLTAPYKTLAETTTGKKRVDIETPGNQKDDTFDLFTFGFLAANVIEDEDPITDFSMNARPGSGVSP
jgi:hypothetical protein